MIAVLGIVLILPGAARAISFGGWATANGYSPGAVMPSEVWALSSSINDISNIGDYNWNTTPTTALYLHNNEISDISAVSGLNNLTGLNLHNNQISDISAVSGLNNLTYLELGRNQISNISPVSGWTNLTRLFLGYNQISDISAVSGLNNLTSLYLYHNQISDISAVSGLTNLTRLYLWNNQISDISAVSGLTNLTRLRLFNNQISDISAVSGLNNLTYLDLYSNQISDISAVSGLTNLTRLQLRDNQISDISAVSGLTNLTDLQLGDNTPMTELNLEGAGFFSLTFFDVGGNTSMTSVSLKDAVLNQTMLAVLLDGGSASSSCIGIGELPGITDFDLGGVDFSLVTDLSVMNTMDDLETLLLEGATNLDGSQLWSLTAELDSLNWLDVTGPWDSFDPATQSSLSTWDAIEGNTLVVVPEPSPFSLDIKPGSDENPLNLKSKGVLPVSILTTDEFDALTVDIETLVFGDPLLIDGGSTAVPPIRFDEGDVNDDGLLDLTLFFSVSELVENGFLGPLSEEASLTGALFDGTDIIGSDILRIVPKSRGGFVGPINEAEFLALGGSTNFSPVPEPSSLTLLLLGAISMLCWGRRNRR